MSEAVISAEAESDSVELLPVVHIGQADGGWEVSSWQSACFIASGTALSGCRCWYGLSRVIRKTPAYLHQYTLALAWIDAFDFGPGIVRLKPLRSGSAPV
jgi:hypothetical protein